MRHRLLFFANLFISVLLACAPSAAQPSPSRLKPGDVLPPLAGQSLTGNWVNITSVSGRNRAVVVFSFSRAGGHDAQSWIQRLRKDDPHLEIYTIIFLQSVPGPFRAMAVAGIKSGVPLALQDRTIVLYRDEELWKSRLHVDDDRNACVMLLGSVGQIRLITPGPFADPIYSEFSKSIRAQY